MMRGIVSRKCPMMLTGLLWILWAANGQAGEKLHFKNGIINTSPQIFLNQGTFGTQSQQPISNNETTLYYVVQFNQKLNHGHKQVLKRYADVLRYIPDDAYLVRLKDPKYIEPLKTHPMVQVAIPFTRPLKVSQEFATPSIFNSNNAVDAIVSVVNEDTLAEVLDKVTQLSNSKVNFSGGKVVQLKTTMEGVFKIGELEGVEWVEPYTQPQLMIQRMDENEGSGEQPVQPEYLSLNELTGNESGTKIMNFQSAWERSVNGEGQIVAMADTGLDKGKLPTLHADFSNAVEGQVYGIFSRDWSDPMGHGTHVAGSVMGNGSKSDGQIRGGAFAANVLTQGMWSPLLKNLTVPPDLKAMFQKAYDDGARVHTNSWGNPANLGIYDSFAQQADEFMWENQEMLILFAAGNSGEDANRDGKVDSGSVSSPGTSKNVLTVGASENLITKGGIQKAAGESSDEKWGVEPLKSDKFSDNPSGIAAFSSRGPTRDGRIKPDVVAPGTNIVSLCSTVEGSSELWGRFNEDYCFSGGTSMATPLVAGAAAAVRHFLKLEHHMDAPSAALVKALIVSSTNDLFPGQYGFREQAQEIPNPAPNNEEGFGLVNMDKATNSSRFLTLLDSKTGVGEGEPVKLTVNTQGLTSIKVTLVYTDAPGSTSATKTLVNDLNLVVKAGSRVLKGEDDTNNFESIEVTGLNSPSVDIEVLANRIPVTRDGKVPFALIVSK